MKITDYQSAVKATHKAACEILEQDLKSYEQGHDFSFNVAITIIDLLRSFENSYPDILGIAQPD